MTLVAPAPESDPLEVFSAWYEENAKTLPKHPDAMLLATATRDGRPSLRAVLSKGVEQGRFRFFTHYDSRKARELDENPHAALLFFWPNLSRQVRVEGRVERLSVAESDAYFSTRPRESQLSAFVSPQSHETTREALLAARAEAERRFAGAPIPRPAAWGGYALAPESFEFWIADLTRLHLRHRYRREADRWVHAVLAP